LVVRVIVVAVTTGIIGDQISPQISTKPSLELSHQEEARALDEALLAEAYHLILARQRMLCRWGACETAAPCALVLPAATHHVDIDITQYQIASPLKVIIVAVPPCLLPLLFFPPLASISVVSIFPPSPVMVILVIAAIIIANVRSSSEQSLQGWLLFPLHVL
jgi:hypothetical protein